MHNTFSADFFRSNRQGLRQKIGEGLIIIGGNALLQRNSDVSYPFRQDSNFWYLTGVTVQESVLVMTGTDEFLIIPDLSPIDEVMGTPHDFRVLAKRSGIDQVIQATPGWKQLEKLVKAASRVATPQAPDPYSQNYGFYTNPARRTLIERLKGFNPSLATSDLRQPLLEMRTIKQPAELAAIQSAIDITGQAIIDVAGKLNNYKYEHEIEADLTAGFRRRGALGHAFAPIVARGRNTCHIHYEANNSALADSQHLYVDTGAEFELYAADVTRTYFLQKPDRRLKAVYDAVAEVHKFALQRLKAGVSIRQNEKAVEEYMGEQLVKLGLIRQPDPKSTRQYYTHACSHYLGLDPHDVGDYDQPLQPNMVLTVEPGIYIREEGIGVRIEDDVLVTKGGIKNLSQNIPYEL